MLCLIFKAILAAYGRGRLYRTRKTSTPLENLEASGPGHHIELQVLRESTGSIGKENKGLEMGEDVDKGTTQGTIHVNVTSPRKSSTPLASSSKNIDDGKESEVMMMSE